MIYRYILRKLQKMDYNEGFNYLVRCEEITRIFAPKTAAMIRDLVLTIVEG